MKLIHQKSGGIAVVGDPVTDFKGRKGRITHFVPPHSPASAGHVSVDVDNDQPFHLESYHYVSVWGLLWINREDRQ